VTDTGTITRFEVVLITSITSGSAGFGVGVGFGFQTGGGGGKSLTDCACTAGADRKMASTPIRNAGHKSFFSTPRIIFDTLRVCLMPPRLLACMSSYPTAFVTA